MWYFVLKEEIVSGFSRICDGNLGEKVLPVGYFVVALSDLVQKWTKIEHVIFSITANDIPLKISTKLREFKRPKSDSSADGRNWA